MGEILTDEDELLFRQVPKEWCQNGNLLSLAFRPLPRKDEGRLSGDRESLTTAESSFIRFKESGGNTEAVYGLRIHEYSDHNVPCYGDPLPDNPSHAYADFSAFGESKTKKTSQRLRDIAVTRGKIYP